MRSIVQSPPPDPRFVCEDSEPVYLETWRRGLLPDKLAAGQRELEECRICPRDCGVNRLRDERRVGSRSRAVSGAFESPQYLADFLLHRRGQGFGSMGLQDLAQVFVDALDQVPIGNVP